ncbi:MAG: zinc ribbon domain-containing protein, partial [Acidobacteria bacterium]|nr:zinc ribbon domain-containing protein [Acidobacteriota bacterium]
MPLYEYECQDCGARTEELQRFDDPPLTTCPACGGRLSKLVSAPAFQFKGSGWYITDYAGKKGADSAKESGGESASKVS